MPPPTYTMIPISTTKQKMEPDPSTVRVSIARTMPHADGVVYVNVMLHADGSSGTLTVGLGGSLTPPHASATLTVYGTLVALDKHRTPLYEIRTPSDAFVVSYSDHTPLST